MRVSFGAMTKADGTKTAAPARISHERRAMSHGLPSTGPKSQRTPSTARTIGTHASRGRRSGTMSSLVRRPPAFAPTIW